MCGGADLHDRDHISNSAPIRFNRTSKEMHACSWVNITGCSLLRNNVEPVDVGQIIIGLKWVENHPQLDNRMI